MNQGCNQSHIRVMPGSYGDRRPADAARANEGDEPPLSNPVTNLGHRRLATDPHEGSRSEPSSNIGAIAAAVLAILRSDDRADEGIAPSLDVCDISTAELAVPERLADGGYMDAQTSFLYGNARPDVIHKLLLWDDFADALRQIYKNVERPAAEGKLQAIAPKHPFSARKLERAEP